MVKMKAGKKADQRYSGFQMASMLANPIRWGALTVENLVCQRCWGSWMACQRAETRVGMLANHLRTDSSKVGH